VKARKGTGPRVVTGAIKVHNHARGVPFEISVGAYFSRRSPGHVWVDLKHPHVALTLHFNTGGQLRELLADIAGQLAAEEVKAEADRILRERICARPGCGHCWDDHGVMDGGRCFVALMEVGAPCRCEGFVEPPSPALPAPPAAADQPPAAAGGPPPEEGRAPTEPDGGGL
jgi:hypothetical protein